MNRGAWWAAVHRVAKSWTGLKRLSTIKVRAVRLKVSDNDGLNFGIRDRNCLADEPSLGREHPTWQSNPGHSCHRVKVSKCFHCYCPGKPAVLLEPREHPWKPELHRAGSLTHALHPNTAPEGTSLASNKEVSSICKSCAYQVSRLFKRCFLKKTLPILRL